MSRGVAPSCWKECAVAINVEPGQVTTRKELYALYGGSRMNGIVTTKTEHLFVFTDPLATKPNGYDFDGWESSAGQVFYYAGEGKVGDQKMDRGNRALLEHESRKVTVHLLEAIGPDQPGGKPQRYLGEFVLDSKDPFSVERGPDKNGLMRDVFVFRLIRKSDQPPLPSPLVKLRDRNRKTFEKSASRVRNVALEENSDVEFGVAPTAGRTARREEGILSRRFEEHLIAQGHELSRFRLKVPEAAAELVTDPFDETDNTLWEVKASSCRGDVRYAIGQVLDYRLLIEAEREHIEVGVVLPDSPSPSLLELLFSLGIKLAFPREGVWEVHQNSSSMIEA